MVTRHKDLWTGKPVWTGYGVPSLSTSKLSRDIAADVAVIGTGISGAMVAEELSRAGFSVVMVDRRTPARGATFATTALLQYELDTPLTLLSRKIGHADAVRAWRRAKLGLESLAAKIESLGIRCDLERGKSLYLSGNILDRDGLQKEQAARNLAGIHTDFLTRNQLKQKFGAHHAAALLSFGTYTANPLHLTAGFLSAARNEGVSIFSRTDVDDIQHLKSGCEIITEKGPVISVKNIVFATGYEMPKKMKARGHKVHSTYAFATRPQKSRLWPERPMIWEASTPYLYFRTTPDGRVICGGEDEEFSDEESRDALLPEKIPALQKKLAKIFPGLDTRADFAWAGSFGSTATGLPSIGRIPGMPHCYGILGYGGNGITFSRIAAEIIVADMTGRKDPDADLFAF